jgi:signal transduction histidine kinase
LAIEPGGEIRPEFRPAPQDLPVVSAAAVLDGSFDPAQIADRIVFVGMAATGAGDQFVVPTGPGHQPVPGVLAHASACVSILRGRLLRVPPLGWSIVAAFVLAYGIQWIRDRRGIFDFGAFALVAIGIAAISYLSVRFGLLLIPTTSLFAVAVTSALLRETAESWIARRESGRLLSAVLDHVGASPSAVPATAARRLDALHRLQDRILEEDATRKALLDGMDEGVVVWDEQGETALVNPAARKLWNGEPEYTQIMAGRLASDPSIVNRGSREIAVGITDLGRGHLAILRDVTAERALERRRREMQRLVSHELRTPLSSIAGFGESLERYELDGEEQRRVATLIRNEAQRLQEMVTAFLDLERLGGGHWEGSATTVDVGRQVGSRLDVLESAARHKQIAIRRTITDGCLARAVPDLLDRVVDNLVGNAIKYSNEGETIEVEVLRSGDEVELKVRDHGPGIADDQKERIFDRFFRIPGSASTGAGLGLALAKEVVDWHGGCITVNSEIGVGSAFSVRLPAIREE